MLEQDAANAKKDDEPAAKTSKLSEPRASTTDAEVRVMKMADGGFRPAYNVQFATDTKSTAIACVWVDNIGSDMGKMALMSDALERQYGERPGQHLVDGAVAEWRKRMAEDQAKEIYKQRAATAECANAQARNRGMTEFVVRGLEKVKVVALWHALTHNMICSWRLIQA